MVCRGWCPDGWKLERARPGQIMRWGWCGGVQGGGCRGVFRCAGGACWRWRREPCHAAVTGRAGLGTEASFCWGEVGLLIVRDLLFGSSKWMFEPLDRVAREQAPGIESPGFAGRLQHQPGDGRVVRCGCDGVLVRSGCWAGALRRRLLQRKTH